MTIFFQILAGVVIVVAGFLTFRSGGARQQAIRRVTMFVFVLAAASSVFYPQGWTTLANFFGIGRGADLLLYLLVLVFVGFVASTYRRFRHLEHDVTELARKLALLEAPQPADTKAD